MVQHFYPPRSLSRSFQLDVHVFDLRREVRPHLGTFHFQRRRQQSVLHGERVRVQVDVFHLENRHTHEAVIKQNTKKVRGAPPARHDNNIIIFTDIIKCVRVYGGQDACTRQKREYHYILCTFYVIITCSNDFRPPSLPQAVMSSTMSFLTSGFAHRTDNVPDIPFSCAQVLITSTTGTTMAMMHDWKQYRINT